MSRTLLVVPTGHGVGLTVTCLGLVHALQQQGVDVGFFKPLSQPRRGGSPGERSTALVRLTSTLRPPKPIPAETVERRLSRRELGDLMEDVVAAGEGVLSAFDVVVVEGLVPSEGLVYSSRVNLALAKALDADVLLVATPGDGGPERLAETVAISAGTYLAGEAARVVGAVVNRVPGEVTAVAEEYRSALAGRGIRLVGAVPFRPELTWPRIGDLVSGLNASGLDVTLLSEGDQARRVKDVIIAAQAVPGMLPLLQEGRLVIVPGDRHEVVLSSCLAAMSGIRLAGLLLTAGVEPDPRVWDLCRPALATGLPVLVTKELSYDTATRVHAMDPEVPADDEERARRAMAVVSDALDDEWLATLPTPSHVPRLSPPAFRRRLTTAAQAAGKRIVLPEGAEPRTLQAAVACQERGIARCVLLARRADVEAAATGLGLDLPASLEVVDPSEVPERLVDVLVEARRHKGMTADQARELLTDPITLGTVMLKAGDVDGLVAGAEHTTAATVRPALQILGTAPGARLVSSVFFMCLPDDVVIYGDCAVNPNPDAEELADIAV